MSRSRQRASTCSSSAGKETFGGSGSWTGLIRGSRMIGGMTRALFAVGALLAVAFLILGVVVFSTRTEDRIAADNVLAENLTRAIQLAEEQNRGELDLVRVAPFAWDRVLVMAPGTARSAVSKALGSEYKGDLPFGSSGQVFVFARGDQVARIADYR